jgi:hypothetical protein
MGKRTTFLGIFVLLLFTNCSEDKELSSIDPVNWNKRTIQLNQADSLIHGQTYLSVYSQIYSRTEHSRHDLTATVSMRNMNTSDTVYISKAQYFDTKGKLIRTYFEKNIFIAPMETVEIVIDEDDRTGGTGANFLFDWQIKEGVIEPYFEGVMISTTGQQGLSFTTQGKRIWLAD